MTVNRTEAACRCVNACQAANSCRVRLHPRTCGVSLEVSGRRPPAGEAARPWLAQSCLCYIAVVMPDPSSSTSRRRRSGARADVGSGGPHLVVLGGPNGAGNTTATGRLLTGALAVNTFVNADLIASELAPRNPERVAVEAGRRMLGRLEALRRSRATFGLETTLAGRAHAAWLRRCLADGYAVHL